MAKNFFAKRKPKSIYKELISMPNKKAKQRKYDKKKRREAIKKYKRDKKTLRIMLREKKDE